MVTGRFSSSSLRKSGELLQKCIEQSAGVTDVQACHILGKSMMQDIEGKSAVPNKVCVFAMSRVPRRLCHPHLLSRINSLPLLWPSSSALDIKTSLTNSSRRMVCIILATCSPSRPRCIPNLAAWACGSNPPRWCVIISLLSGINLTRA